MDTRVVRDATIRQAVQDELRDARQLAEKTARIKGDFLAMAAHDLTQPQQTMEFLINIIGRELTPGTELAGMVVQLVGRSIGCEN